MGHCGKSTSTASFPLLLGLFNKPTRGVRECTGWGLPVQAPFLQSSLFHTEVFTTGVGDEGFRWVSNHLCSLKMSVHRVLSQHAHLQSTSIFSVHPLTWVPRSSTENSSWRCSLRTHYVSAQAPTLQMRSLRPEHSPQ